MDVAGGSHPLDFGCVYRPLSLFPIARRTTDDSNAAIHSLGRGLGMRNASAAIFAGTFLLVSSQLATAADMPTKAVGAPAIAPPVYNWSGFYVGINGGYGWGPTKQSLVTDTASTAGYHQSGGLIGGTFGLQFQVMTNLVFGIEGDWDYARIDGTLFAPGVCAGALCFTNLQSFGTARARVGYAWDRWLVYGTGGVPWGKINAGQDSCVPIQICGTRGHTGWTAGAGVEAFVWPKVSVKVEYLYADFGEQPLYNPGTTIKVLEKQNIVRAGVKYHF